VARTPSAQPANGLLKISLLRNTSLRRWDHR
jgi:hypothetical protein